VDREDLRRRIRAFLARRNVMTLATAAGDDLWAASVFFAADGLDLLFLSGPDSRHGRHLAARPWAAATVEGEYDDWRKIQGLQLEGPVERLGADELPRALDAYRAKFPWVETMVRVASPPGAATLEVEVGEVRPAVALYRLRPRRIVLVDNRRGFGHREELEIPPEDPPGAQGAS
jgi:uncharacterized protein YhbP (UPF0306 family)